MTVGVRLHGLALARAAAMSAIPTATATVSTVSATPLAAWEDFPSAVETAPKTAATHRPTASITWAAAARRSAAAAPLRTRRRRRRRLRPAPWTWPAAWLAGGLGRGRRLGRGRAAGGPWLAPFPWLALAISHTTLGSQLRRRLALSECEAS